MKIKTIYKTIFNESTRLKIFRIRRKLKGLILAGNQVECNCCGKTFRKFLPKGNGLEIRENAECPNCGSLERTRLLLFYLCRETDMFSKRCKLLHIAPEDSLKKIFQNHKNIEYVNGDLNPYFADEIIDLTDIQYPNDTFDYIICSHVLGHIPDEKKAVQEMRRVLKPNGIAFVLTLISNDHLSTFENSELFTDEQRLKAYGEKDLVRLHGCDFKKRLSINGFEVQPIDYTQKLKVKTIQRFKVVNTGRETIFKCIKL